MLEDTGASPPSAVDAPGRGWLLRPSWAGGGSPGLGFSRWEFQPPMWRNGLGVHRACWADRVAAARSLANDCLREQPRIGREKTLHEVLTAGARKSYPESGTWSQAVLSSRESRHTSSPLPGPQCSHLKNGNMTYVTGSFEQLYKMWSDMMNSGELQRTAKPSWSLLC